MKGLRKAPLLLACVGLGILLSACGSEQDAMDFRSAAEYSTVDVSGDRYNEIVENPFISTAEEPISTFSIDADGASYANVRRYLQEDQMPPTNAVRVEELINYFDFNYPEPKGEHPLSVNLEMATTPWNEASNLIRIGLKGKTIEDQDLPPANFVFLVDASGSMNGTDRIELVKHGLSRMAEKLSSDDIVSIVTYSGNAKVVLEPTKGSETETIQRAVSGLRTGGSTNGEGGILKAYELAADAYIQGGNNRIIMCTDGDFNVGSTGEGDLVDLIEEKRETGIFLTMVGVGRGNLNDGTMEQVANHGNGTYEYLDSKDQAEKVFVTRLPRMLTVAQDVKIQVEFNPNMIATYRLIGYENRLLDNEDFEDDSKDAGELGMGQNVTALYEVTMQPMIAKKEHQLTFRFNYKEPTTASSKLIEIAYNPSVPDFENATAEFQFAASVASWGMLLRNSEYAGTATYAQVREWAKTGISFDPDGSRSEFLSLVSRSEWLSE